jgi:hypothetical protein
MLGFLVSGQVSFANQFSLIKSERHNNCRIIINNQQKQYIDELVDLSSESFEFNTRRAAFSLLKELKISNDKAAEHAMNAAKNPNNRLANGGLGYLIWLYKEVPEMKNVVLRLMDSLGNSDWEAKIKERILAGK